MGNLTDFVCRPCPVVVQSSCPPLLMPSVPLVQPPTVPGPHPQTEIAGSGKLGFLERQFETVKDSGKRQGVDFRIQAELINERGQLEKRIFSVQYTVEKGSEKKTPELYEQQSDGSFKKSEFALSFYADGTLYSREGKRMGDYGLASSVTSELEKHPTVWVAGTLKKEGEPFEVYDQSRMTLGGKKTLIVNAPPPNAVRAFHRVEQSLLEDFRGQSGLLYQKATGETWCRAEWRDAGRDSSLSHETLIQELKKRGVDFSNAPSTGQREWTGLSEGRTVRQDSSGVYIVHKVAMPTAMMSSDGSLLLGKAGESREYIVAPSPKVKNNLVDKTPDTFPPAFAGDATTPSKEGVGGPMGITLPTVTPGHEEVAIKPKSAIQLPPAQLLPSLDLQTDQLGLEGSAALRHSLRVMQSRYLLIQDLLHKVTGQDKWVSDPSRLPQTLDRTSLRKFFEIDLRGEIEPAHRLLRKSTGEKGKELLGNIEDHISITGVMLSARETKQDITLALRDVVKNYQREMQSYLVEQKCLKVGEMFDLTKVIPVNEQEFLALRKADPSVTRDGFEKMNQQAKQVCDAIAKQRTFLEQEFGQDFAGRMAKFPDQMSLLETQICADMIATKFRQRNSGKTPSLLVRQGMIEGTVAAETLEIAAIFKELFGSKLSKEMKKGSTLEDAEFACESSRTEYECSVVDHTRATRKDIFFQMSSKEKGQASRVHPLLVSLPVRKQD